MSTFVLSATVESPCIANAISLPSGDTATSPSPPVAIVGASWSIGVMSLAPPLSATVTRNRCCRFPTRQSSQWRHMSSVQIRASVGVSDPVWLPDGGGLVVTSDLKWPADQASDRRSGDYPTEAENGTELMGRHWDDTR